MNNPVHNIVYDWIDPQLWADKEFVMAVLEKDCPVVVRVSAALASDEEFRAYIEENIDLAWDMQYVPQEKIPQWIKDWIK